MRYTRVDWKHDVAGDPLTIFTELDGQLWEQRKIEVFRDGKLGYADNDEESGGSMLGIEPWPNLETLGREPEFEIADISKEEFEGRWLQRR
ncbi:MULTISPECIES: DUF6881 domain-containing protein [unclassified Variovorax]|uniref:DUF6881 domain-containing protein n=1 Tax=unclassified Variovorax TaxID=663243 RepID=UPI003F446716